MMKVSLMDVAVMMGKMPRLCIYMPLQTLTIEYALNR